jgi:hypothetical protein
VELRNGDLFVDGSIIGDVQTQERVYRIHATGEIVGQVQISGTWSSICGDNIDPTQPLPPNITIDGTGMSGSVCDIFANTSSACAAQVVSAPQAEAVPKAKSRYITFAPGSCQSTANPPGPCEYAIRVGMTSLYHPDPPPSEGIPPDFSLLEGEWRYVNRVPGALSRCCNPNSNPLACNITASCDEHSDCGGFGLNTRCVKQLCPDSPAYGTFFPCAQLGCNPDYVNWGAETDGWALHVTGAEIVPSSVYHVQLIGSECDDPVMNWANYTSALEVETNAWSNVDNQGNVAGAGDIGWVVDKVQDKAMAAIKPVAKLQAAVPNSMGLVNVLDIAKAIDAVGGRHYPFEMSVCTSSVLCNDVSCLEDGVPDISKCGPNQTCIDGHCHDEFGRCAPQ